MRLGYAQFAPRLGDLEGNRNTVEELVRNAPPFDLLVLPELANSGYNFASRADAWSASEPVPGGPFTELLRRLAAERSATLVAGICERAGDRLYNSAVVVGPGGLLGLYRKLHLFLNEKDLFTAGDLGLPVFDLAGCCVGCLICFDWQFPEAWRVLALRGAEIICHPSNLVIPGRAQRAVPIHAMLNRVFVATANRFGTERGLSFTGRSFLVDPSGELLAEAPSTGADVRIVEIEPARARDKRVNDRNDLLGDRRPEWYGDLLKDAREPLGPPPPR